MSNVDDDELAMAKAAIRGALEGIDDVDQQAALLTALADVMQTVSPVVYTCPEGHLAPQPPVPDDWGPPDPDRHGNRRHRIDCGQCGASGTVVMLRRGGTRTPPDWDVVD